MYVQTENMYNTKQKKKFMKEKLRDYLVDLVLDDFSNIQIVTYCRVCNTIIVIDRRFVDLTSRKLILANYTSFHMF